MNYSIGNIIKGTVVVNPPTPGFFTYLQPGGVFNYKRPDGTSTYKRP